MSDGFKAQDIGLRAQKKILSRMATKGTAKIFIDDTTASLLDNLYKLLKPHAASKKEAEKIIKNIIKIVIKLGVLYRNNQFTTEELKQAEIFKRKFHSASMAIISFYEVEYTYDRLYLIKAFQECHNCLKDIISRHLTEKTLLRIESVFKFFTNPTFLDSIFKSGSEHSEALGRLVADMNKIVDEGGM